jgi:outer membrane lipoprotein-sorting protein
MGLDVNKFLRTASTRRLLATIVGALAAAVAGTAIAIAAVGSGPVPRHQPLARAIHHALAARAPQGVFARITFTNNLIDSSEIQGSDPLLNGGTGRLWITAHRLRLEIQGDNGDAQIVLNGRSLWAYDPAFNTVYRATLPASLFGTSKHRASHGAQPLPSLAQIQSGLNRLARHLDLSGAMPTDVAGQAAYSLRVSPRRDNGLLGAAELAWDAIRGVPLSIGLYARGNPTPVLQLAATDISYGPQSPSVFDISPPSGAHVVSLSRHAASTRTQPVSAAEHHAPVTGVRAVAKRVPFTLQAPASLVGRPRTAVGLVGLSGHPAALLLYGHGLGTVVVLEQTVGHMHTIQAPSGGDQPGLSLPTVSIRDASGQQLETSIGTVLQFSRSGVSYTVLGSVTAATADAAARGL